MCLTFDLFMTPFKTTKFHSPIAIMHCTGVSGTVSLFQDGGHIGMSLQMAAAASGASSDVMTQMTLILEEEEEVVARKGFPGLYRNEGSPFQ